MSQINSRFVIKNGEKTDVWMRAWMDILAIDRAGISAVNRKRCRREVEKNLRVFGLCDVEDWQPSAELKKEWEAFSGDYIRSCMESRMFRGMILGYAKRTDQQTAKLIRDEICLVTGRIPEKLGLAQMAMPLQDVMLKVCDSM